MRATQLIFLLALLITQVLCETYYLSATGSTEEGDGTETNPFSSFAKAFNATDGSSPLELYVFPGLYAGEDNTGVSYAGALTINWYQNNTAEEGDPTTVEIDCTSSQALACLSSGTSITINGLDESENPQIIFQDCGICVSINKTTEEKSASYFVDIEGVTFDEVTQYAVFADNIYQATISNSSFTDNDAAGLTLISLSNVDELIEILDNYFSSTNQNALFLFNVTKAEVYRNTFENAFIFAQGLNSASQVLITNNTFSSNANIVASTYVVTLNIGTFTVESTKFNTQGISALKSSMSPTTSILGSSFEMGDGIDGGAAYFENVDTVTVSENCYFYQNIASGFGGAIYLVNSSIHMDATNFTGNVAVNGAAIGCAGNETVSYDNTTVVFLGNSNLGPGTDLSYIQNTCNIQIQSFQTSLVVSTIDNSSDAWIWILVSIAIVFIVLIIIAVAVFVIYQRKRQSYTRMD